MRYSTTVVLMVVAAGLAAYVYFVERHAKTTDQVEADRVKVAPGFDRDAVTKITITRTGHPEIILERSGGEVSWQLTAPKASRADATAVSEILSTVEFLEYRAKVSDPGARNRKEYGLARATLRLLVAGKELTLVVGNDDASGQGVYAARGQEPTVYVVERRIRELLERSSDELRERRVATIDATKVTELKIGEAVLVKEGDGWRFSSPYRLRASTSRVADLIRGLETTRATRFITGSTTAAGWNVIVKGTVEHSLTIGGECPDHPDEVLAVRAAPDPATFCLKKSDATRLTAKPETLRDLRLLPIRPDDARRVTVDAGGSKLVLTREGTAWKVTAPAEGPADGAVVRKWLEDLGAYRALSLAERPEGGSTPVATVTVETEGGASLRVALGAAKDGRRWARRGQEGLWLQVHAEAGEMITADPLHFRSRKVVAVSRWQVTSLSITRGKVTEVAERSATEKWRLLRPMALDADTEVVDQLLTTMADLQAERFVASTPPAAFSQPVELKVTTKPSTAADSDAGPPQPTSHTLELGGDTSTGDCYARSGTTAMVLARSACEALRVHLVTRRIISLGAAAPTRVVIARGAKTTALEKRGPAWHRATGPRVPAEEMDELLATIRSLKADAVLSYGTHPSLAKPKLTVTLTTEGEKTVRLAVGTQQARGFVGSVQGRDVTYLLPQRAVEVFEKHGP